MKWTIKRTGTLTNTFYVTFLKRNCGILTKGKTEGASKFLCEVLRVAESFFWLLIEVLIPQSQKV